MLPFSSPPQRGGGGTTPDSDVCERWKFLIWISAMGNAHAKCVRPGEKENAILADGSRGKCKIARERNRVADKPRNANTRVARVLVYRGLRSVRDIQVLRNGGNKSRRCEKIPAHSTKHTGRLRDCRPRLCKVHLRFPRGNISSRFVGE